MNDKPTTPAPPQKADTPAEVTTLFGDPVIRGPAHHVQSITPIRTVESQPIKKRHTRGWWKRQPPDRN